MRFDQTGTVGEIPSSGRIISLTVSWPHARCVGMALVVLFSACPVRAGGTSVSISGTQWLINGKLTNPGTPCEGLLMNVRMVNATFEDRSRPDFDADANTAAFIARLPEYASHGVNAMTLCLQGGMPGYEGAVNSAFNSDGSLHDKYLKRVDLAIRACDAQRIVVILGLYYQQQSRIPADEAAVRSGVVNAVRWLQQGGYCMLHNGRWNETQVIPE